ncbi:hypothetical protein N7451_006057 [Penicillium sp. IBT 35674x]|nr:hypothetical protein N7451_006057 [Penicillium sp. IBT 35674x]
MYTNAPRPISFPGFGTRETRCTLYWLFLLKVYGQQLRTQDVLIPNCLQHLHHPRQILQHASTDRDHRDLSADGLQHPALSATNVHD